MPAALPPCIALIGCGNMGGALLRGWLKIYPDQPCVIVEPHTLPADLAALQNIRPFTTIEAAAETLKTTEIIVLAVKPQIIRKACAQLAPLLQPSSLVMSVAAGTTLQNLAAELGAHRPIVRVMPNTPAAIGQGISVMIANPHVGATQKRQAEALLQPAGAVEWIEDESLMNAVTALSGSGPAYIFFLIEALTKAGETIGLPPALAERLARQTVIGSAALAQSNPATAAGTLRAQVTSPGGTTAAALDILMNGAMQEIFNAALAAAKKRGEELNA